MLWGVGLAIWIGRGFALGPLNVQAGDIALVLSVLLVLATFAAKPHARLRFTPRAGSVAFGLCAAIVAIIVAAIVSVSGSTDPLAVVRFSGRWALGLFATMALYWLLNSECRLKTLERALLLGGIASVSMAIAGFFIDSLGSLTIRFGDRSQALLNHPNQFAILLASCIPVAISAVLGRVRRWFPWLALVALIVGLALTGSKFNLFAMGVMLPVSAFACLLVMPGTRRKLELLVAVPVGLAMLGVVGALVVQRFNPRTIGTLGNLLTDPADVSAVVSRRELWHAALRLGLEHPFTGVGADQTSQFLPFDHAHNVFLEFFASMGIWGLVALCFFLSILLWLVGWSLFTAFQSRKLGLHTRLGLIGSALASIQFVISNQSSDSFGGTTLPILWVLIALLLARWNLAVRRPSSGWVARADGALRCIAPTQVRQ